VFWLWLTVLFGTFAEALAEGRGKAQAAALRTTKAELRGRRVKGDAVQEVAASDLRRGDIDTLLLDKTGTITLGDRQAAEFLPLDGVREEDMIAAAWLSSLGDETPEGRSVVTLSAREGRIPDGADIVAFTAQTRVSGIDHAGRQIRKGAVDAVLRLQAFEPSAECAVRALADRIARAGGTPHPGACHAA